MKIKKEDRQKLGERELDIMQALWNLSLATVADVQQELSKSGFDIAYTTIQTMLNRLETKGHVARKVIGRAHLYRPLLKESAVVKGTLKRIAERFFKGSAEELVVRLVEQDLSAKQLDRLRLLIESRREKDRKK
jgi:predicted transcriptional regulator